MYKKNDYLEHHGIHGQRWGEQNGPPYPLKQGAHSAAEKRAMSNTGSGSSSKGKTSKTISSKLTKQNSTDTINSLIKSGKAHVDNLQNYEVGWTEFTNSAASGQKFVSGLVGGHDFDWQEYDWAPPDGGNDYAPSAKHIAQQNVRGKWHSKLSDDEMALCNPDYGSPGTTQNCADCSAALELMQRGYSCNAGRQSFPSTCDAMSIWFKGAQQVGYDDIDSAQEGLQSYGKCTSGTISISYAAGGGHAMHWTNDENGNFEIQDGQNGRRFHSVREMADEYGADASLGIRGYRLDNCEPNWDAMAQDSVVSSRVVKNSRTGQLQQNGHSNVRNRWSGQEVQTW